VNERVYGTVINVNAYGAAVRLEGGELASAPAGDVEAHRTDYERGLASKQAIAFLLHPSPRRPMVTIVPRIDEPDLDAQIARYLESTQEWDADADGVPSAERHFLRKKKRAAHFE
jgi:hypothetical protein